MAKTKTQKQRNHNEWFRDVKRPRTCPSCGHKHTQVYSWGEYINQKWHNVKQFCERCFATQVYLLLKTHAKDCGCSITLQWKGNRSVAEGVSDQRIGDGRPDWLVSEILSPQEIQERERVAKAEREYEERMDNYVRRN